MTDQDGAEALERVARMFLKHGQPGDAGKLLDAASVLAPDSASILRLRTLAAFQCGAYEQAMALSNTALRGEPPSGQRALAVLEAVCLMRLGRPAEARTRFNSAGDIDAAREPATDTARSQIFPGEGPEAA